MKGFDKKAGVIGAVVGAVTGAITGVTNLPLLERIAVGCIAGVVVGLIIYLVWK